MEVPLGRVELLLPETSGRPTMAAFAPEEREVPSILTASVDDLLREKGLPVDEIYAPPWSRAANVPDMETYQRMYRQSLDQPQEFWTDMTYKMLRWMAPWRKLKHENLEKVEQRRGGSSRTVGCCAHCADGQIRCCALASCFGF